MSHLSLCILLQVASLLLLAACVLELTAAQSAVTDGSGQTAGGGEGPIPLPPATIPAPGGEPVDGGGSEGDGSTPPSEDKPAGDELDSAGGPSASSSDTLPVWSIIVIVIAGSLLVLFFGMKLANPRGNHFDVIVFFLAIVDFGSDVWFIYTLSANDSSDIVFRMAIVFTAVPLLLNLCSLAYAIWLEMSNLAFRRWLNHNFAPFTAVVLTSCTNLDAMFVLDSHVCGLSFLRAPWSDRMVTTIRLLGLITILFEDIPQTCIQIYVISTSSYQLVNLIALCSSLTTIVFGVTKRVLICCVWQFDRRNGETEAGMEDLEAGHTHDHKSDPMAIKQLASGVGVAGVEHEMPSRTEFESPVKPVQADEVTIRTLQVASAEMTEKEYNKPQDRSFSEKSRLAYGGEPRTLLCPSRAGVDKEWSTPESQSRRLSLGAGAAPMVQGSSGVSAPIPLGSAVHMSSPASASEQSSFERATSISPALVLPPTSTTSVAAQEHTPRLGLRTSGPVAAAGMAPQLYVDSSSPRPAIPPRPPSAHNSPMAVRRSLAGGASALPPAGACTMSSHSQQTANYYSPQMPRRSLHMPTGSGLANSHSSHSISSPVVHPSVVAAASPPIPARPLSCTHAGTVARASAPVLTASPAAGAPLLTVTGRPPTFTVATADCRTSASFAT